MSDKFEAEFLVEKPEGQRIWVVRAAGGAFVRHFRTHGVIAVGHVNGIKLSAGEIDEKTLTNLEAMLQKVDPERKKASITSHANQVRSMGSSRFFGNRRQNPKTARNLYAGFHYLE